MKKPRLIVFCILCLTCAIETCFPAAPDSTARKLQAAASVSINSNGIASIPAFSLDKPAIIASLSLIKGRFSYDPVLAYGLNMKPWFVDNWLHYRVISKTIFTLRVGWNFSTFFSQSSMEGMTILRGDRYFAGEIAGFYKLSTRNTLSLMYWSDNGIEPGTISGYYISLADEITDLSLGDNLLFGAAGQVFYINYDGPNDGLFISPRVSLAVRDVPVAAYLQATQVLTSNITPSPGFKWNAGLQYNF